MGIDTSLCRAIIFHIMKKFHDTKSPTRAIRVPAAVHLQAKIAAALEGLPLGVLAADALERELIRRRPASDKGQPQP